MDIKSVLVRQRASWQKGAIDNTKVILDKMGFKRKNADDIKLSPKLLKDSDN